jgi:hypothetical protein
MTDNPPWCGCTRPVSPSRLDAPGRSSPSRHTNPDMSPSQRTPSVLARQLQLRAPRACTRRNRRGSAPWRRWGMTWVSRIISLCRVPVRAGQWTEPPAISPQVSRTSEAVWHGVGAGAEHASARTGMTRDEGALYTCTWSIRWVDDVGCGTRTHTAASPRERRGGGCLDRLPRDWLMGIASGILDTESLARICRHRQARPVPQAGQTFDALATSQWRDAA